MAAADPEILLLFEEWLEALEEEMVSAARESASFDPGDLARKLGLTPGGVEFLLAKLRREGKLPGTLGA
jgi:hypothetical protein